MWTSGWANSASTLRGGAATRPRPGPAAPAHHHTQQAGRAPHLARCQVTGLCRLPSRLRQGRPPRPWPPSGPGRCARATGVWLRSSDPGARPPAPPGGTLEKLAPPGADGRGRRWAVPCRCASTTSLASFKPRPVAARKCLMAWMGSCRANASCTSTGRADTVGTVASVAGRWVGLAHTAPPKRAAHSVGVLAYRVLQGRQHGLAQAQLGGGEGGQVQLHQPGGGGVRGGRQFIGRHHLVQKTGAHRLLRRNRAGR